LDAVEVAVRLMEDDPQLNAGFGSVLARDGSLELDAGIATSDGRIGGVSNVAVKHPVSLARRVLEGTPHVLIAGAGAMELAVNMELLEKTSDRQRERWEAAHAAGALDPARFGHPDHVDTVGSVALDAEGLLAAASSTGGVFGQLPGRVGDAPIFGAGIYASRDVAVVGTGVGELFLAHLASFRAGELVESGVHPQEACEDVIARIGRTDRRSAGLLALDVAGRVGAAFRGEVWSVEGPDGPVVLVQLP
jgi:isoaspartyl peptidase/L-asparaginase-like protein (Ntn-hydrolase superfamily)